MTVDQQPLPRGGGALLRALRRNKGLNVDVAARRIGIGRATLDRAERDQTTMPQAATAFAIAQFYGVEVTDIWPEHTCRPRAAA